MLFYRAALPLSRKTLNYAAGVIRRQRRAIGSCWRKLNPAQQALLVLAYLRKGETFADLAAGAGISTATAWRYVNEAAVGAGAIALVVGFSLVVLIAYNYPYAGSLAIGTTPYRSGILAQYFQPHP